jgi:hypothetical protein
MQVREIEEKLFGRKLPKMIYVLVGLSLILLVIGELTHPWFGYVGLFLNLVVITSLFFLKD